MSEWSEKTLSDLGDFARGKSKHRPRDAVHLYGGPYPFIQTGDVKASNHVITEYSQTYSEAGLAQSKLWPAGTLCITIAANIAETGILSFPACFPDSVIGFSADPEKSNIDFVEYLLQFFRQRVQKQAIGSVQDNINLGTFQEFVFMVPELPEQEVIAEILSSLDEKIELNRKQNRTLEAIAQALFKRWFVEFEFPDENGRPYQSSGGAMQPSELGEIPVGWEVKALDQIAEYLNGLALQKFPPEGDEYLPVIKIREMKQGVTASSDRASAKLDPKYILDDGDVLFSWSGSLEVDIWCHGKGALNQHLFKVTSGNYPKWFYYLWTKHHLRAFQAVAADKATTMGHIQRGHLSDALTVCPQDVMLPVLSGIFEPLIDKIIACRIESRILARLRDTLLPKLMSGELRVA